MDPRDMEIAKAFEAGVDQHDVSGQVNDLIHQHPEDLEVALRQYHPTEEN